MNKIVENQIADYVLDKKIKTRTILSNSFNMVCEKILLENSEAFVTKYYQNKEKGFNSKKWSEVSLALKQILINRYGEESKQFVKHKEAIEYVNRINLYYKTLSILDRSNELFLLTQN